MEGNGGGAKLVRLAYNRTCWPSRLEANILRKTNEKLQSTVRLECVICLGVCVCVCKLMAPDQFLQNGCFLPLEHQRLMG